MQQFSQFIVNHWAMCLTLMIVFVMIVINEIMALKTKSQEVSPQSAVNFINQSNAVVIDLRDANSYAKGHIIDAIHVNADDLSKNKLHKYKNNPIIFVFPRELQPTALIKKLRLQGANQQLMVLSKGMQAWQAAELPIVTNLKNV
ncbi:MAG: hypothetical protein A3F46_09560 [Legionellales bacterium RIFCSPHIGHO2_12_FULL_42_9]|nr:MAG: hypothetical protein A3F46_09560 [Legionellales bacterium RIFCSPHIGHO2_12_FULL_42_9]